MGPVLPIIVLAAIVVVSSKKKALAVAQPVAPPPSPLPPGMPPPPPSGFVPTHIPTSATCNYGLLHEGPMGSLADYPVGAVPMTLMSAYEAGLLLWFNTAPMLPGYWMLNRNCGGVGWLVIATRKVIAGSVAGL